MTNINGFSLETVTTEEVMHGLKMEKHFKYLDNMLNSNKIKEPWMKKVCKVDLVGKYLKTRPHLGTSKII